MPHKHTLPSFLTGKVQPQLYERWLQRKASAHVRRDRKRASPKAMVAQYKEAIHAAVLNSGGLDEYTGEHLNWPLIGTYNNDESKLHRHVYKARFALLPTVDHCGPGGTEASFRICGWAVNDAKSDLLLRDFLKLCEKVIAYSKKKRRSPNKSLERTRDG
jgi:hypothetical protein